MNYGRVIVNDDSRTASAQNDLSRGLREHTIPAAMDVARCLDVSLRQVYRSSTSSLAVPGFGMVAVALGEDRPLAWLDPPMRVVTAVSLPRSLAGRRPLEVAYHPLFVAKRRRIAALAVESTPDDKRAWAVGKWLSIVEVNLTASQVGNHILRAQEEEGAADLTQDILDDVFASKAVATLNARSTAMLMYVGWHGRNAPAGVPALPVQEEMMYSYLTALRVQRAPATRAASFLQAWSFCVHVMGFADPSEAGTSLRCQGAAHRQFLNKRAMCSKDPLTMPMLWLLEVAACFEQDLLMRVIAGYVCLCAHGRLRCADGNLIVALDYAPVLGEDGCLTGGFLEASIRGNKTSKTKEKQTSFLPVVAALVGVSGLNWMKAFMQAREALGLGEIPEDGRARADEARVLMLPAWRSGSFRLSEPISSEAVAAGILLTLRKAGMGRECMENVASHSMKTTWLTAAGKAGTPSATRQLLGYHVVKGEASSLNYNRDNLAAPMDELGKVAESVRCGRFVPDAARGARWVHDEAHQVPIEIQVERLVGLTAVSARALFERQDERLFDDEEREGYNGEPKDGEPGEPLGGVPSEGASDRESEPCDGEPRVPYEGESDDDDVSQPDDGLHEVGSPQLHDEGDTDVVDVGASGSDASRLGPVRPECGDANDSIALAVCGQLFAVATQSIEAVAVLYRHVERKTVHFGHASDEARLACGRLLSDKYTRLAMEAMLWPKCRDCFIE
jgi:hypothetical protein